jgi:FKBP-type peptidyl-prolyl cis-trans isomerase FkpA
MRKITAVVYGVEASLAVIVAGVFLWLHYNPSTPLDNSNGGTVPLNLGNTGQGQSVVLNDQTQSGVGEQSTGLSNTTANGSTSTQVSDSSSNGQTAPTAAELAAYDRYSASQSAMYVDVQVGTGSSVAVGDTPVINYVGYLSDGKVFDDSYTRGKAFSFVVGKHQVVTGLEEGIVGMKVGGIRRIIIPASVGYGTKAVGPVPANSLLVIDVSLVAKE